MLDYLRNSLKDNIIIKGFMGVLAMSFGIWGVGDFMGASKLSPGVILKAGDAEVRTDLFQRRFQREMDQFREAMGGRQVADEIMKRSVMANMMRTFTTTTVIDAATRDMGIRISRDQIREDTVSDDAFKQSGKFSQLQYQRVLQESGMTESTYLALTSSDLRAKELMQPVAANATAPSFLVDGLFAFRGETRAADTILIPTASIELQKVPTDDELKALYDKNIAAYTAPEYRKLTVLVLGAADLVKPESIDEADVKKYYDENSTRYRAPETRHLAQIVFDSKEKADAARAMAAPGDTLETLATKAKAGKVIDLGELMTTSPLAKTLAPAFTAQVHELTPPIQTPLGWHVIEVKAITPEAIKTYDMVKDEVRKAIALDKGNDAVYDASTHMEDALASGTPTDEVATTVGARVIKIASIDQQGQDRAGNSVPDVIDSKNFIATAFATPVGKDSRLMDLPARDGYYVIHTEEITPPTPKPLVDVRAQVANLWEAQERQTQALALATKLASNVGPSTQFPTLDTKVKNASYAPLGPLTRFGEGLQAQHVIDATRVSPEVLDKLFGAKVGDTIVAPVTTGVLIARLQAIEFPKATGELARVQAQLTEGVRQQIAGDLVDQMTRAFTQRYPIEVDQKAIDSLAGVPQ